MTLPHEAYDAGSPGPDLSTPASRLVDHAHVIVCCGSGGVGKTTVAASLAVEAARRGRSSVVVTIDPAKRLADALGLTELTNTPRAVPATLWDPLGTAVHGGRLSAAMLDARTTFDGLVHQYAASEEQATRILQNRFYRNIAGALSGTQEYMAAELLHQLHETGTYELIVVDTPPTRHALDFLDAPNRLARLLDNRIFRVLIAPARGPLHATTMAVRALLRTIGQVVGTNVVDDVVAFFETFEGMDKGFRDRARAVNALLAEPSTAFVAVTMPERDPLNETVDFATHLRARTHRVSLVIVNQVHPEMTPLPASVLHDRASELASLAGSRDERGRAADRLAGAYAALATLTDMVGAEQARTIDAMAQVKAVNVVHVPILDDDVHGFGALHEIGLHLLGERPPPWSAAQPAPSAGGTSERREPGIPASIEGGPGGSAPEAPTGDR